MIMFILHVTVCVVSVVVHDSFDVLYLVSLSCASFWCSSFYCPRLLSIHISFSTICVYRNVMSEIVSIIFIIFLSRCVRCIVIEFRNRLLGCTYNDNYQCLIYIYIYIYINIRNIYYYGVAIIYDVLCAAVWIISTISGWSSDNIKSGANIGGHAILFVISVLSDYILFKSKIM